MPLLSGSILLEVANTYCFAVPAFSIDIPDLLSPILEEVHLEGSPAFIHIRAERLHDRDATYLVDAVRSSLERSEVPASLHLEGVREITEVVFALRFGFTSLSLDNSERNLEESVEFTRKVISLCTPSGVSVEADAGGPKGSSPDIKVEFVRRTGVHSLILEPDEITPVKGLLDIPVSLKDVPARYYEYVLETSRLGGRPELKEGFTDEEVRRLVEAGANKVVTWEDICLAFNAGLRSSLYNRREILEPKETLRPALERVRDLVRRRIKVCGSSGRASLF